MIDGPARRWIRWTRAVALGLAVMTATAAPVVAKPDRAAAARARSEAKRHFDRAESLYALGRFAEALTEYERAFELTPLPGIMENIAQAHRNLDHLDQAAFSYRKYLQLAPRAHDRAEVLAMIDELEAEARKRAEPARAASDAREAARAAAEARAAADARATAEAQARIDASLAARPAPR
ncbi:MAG: tetratricopeptide repeat protein, partial [Deltaproteobacteria bacterium]|nr:tetratricopeptide repeat protein [Deltaproteobacteria bacterium]